ncbi:LacI family DNA-binding transcriptional regulator [Cohnella zeiphila]|uniref:LacI family DNA-binding transcriptional regulator n=1 Tax=Cohnella zeiphila TaxID=2761120 RepID=A0A7X0SRK6_9BACL|nr:LacI family DNA-binding transcriptional regulator [Cohnella zeiphila]MBB6734806.1 LacI family DNA-binding transcriptional regulator [Cohnella zeiphila]
MKLKEIAAKANVSISTVSRIINNQGNFSEATRRKVMEIAKEYLKPGVTPAKIGGLTYTIAVFVPEVHDFVDNDPASSADLSHLKEEFESCGHQFLLATHSRGAPASGSAYRLLNDNKVDAAIVFDSFVDDRLVDELIEQGIPYLVTNGRRYDRVQNYIDYDNRKGAYEVIQYLHRLGHRTIGLIAGPEDHLVSQNRLDGCKDAFRDLGLAWNDRNVLAGAFDPSHGYQAAKQLIGQRSGITALFAFNDIMAFGAMKALSEMKLKIPKEISLVGFDDLKLSEYMTPPLTTVRRFRYDISGLIVKMLTELITNKTISEVNISLKTELIERESCASAHVKGS